MPEPNPCPPLTEPVAKIPVPIRKRKNLHNIATQYCSKCDQWFFLKTQFTSTWRWFEVKCYTWISEHLYLEASVYAWDLPPFSWWFSVKWSCKDFGDLTCHQDLTYTSVHVIWENVSYSDDSLIFGTQSEDIHFLLLCWGLLTVHTLCSGFARPPPFWTQPVPRPWETFFFCLNKS